MTISIFNTIFRQALGRILPTSPASETKIQISKKRKFDDGMHDKEAQSRRRKRDDEEDNNEIITKRKRVDEDNFTPIVYGETFESTPISAPSVDHTGTNRKPDSLLMPPPALTTFRTKAVSSTVETESGSESLDFDDVTQVSFETKTRHNSKSNDFADAYDMERARRHAAATTLPPNSGIWEQGEKNLFYHLSYRGFEPLFRKEWMRDFPTMPLSLFQPQDSDELPLIEVLHDKGKFRAIKALRELLELGKEVRDKHLASPSVKKEAIIEKAIDKYISWALWDGNLRFSTRRTAATWNNTLPVHVVVKLKPRQTTANCLTEMKHKLHELAARHREARNIHASIERDAEGYDSPVSDDETRLVESADDDLPVLYGLMVCNGVLAVFTMNSRTPPQSHPRVHSSALDQYQLSPTPSESVYVNARDSAASTQTEIRLRKLGLANEAIGVEEDDSASDPRFISDFDFSDPGKDVWNALVIAIVAMQIREELFMQESCPRSKDETDDILLGNEEDSVINNFNEDDPDA